jgi:cobalt-zinc-cadmium efflux system protein
MRFPRNSRRPRIDGLRQCVARKSSDFRRTIRDVTRTIRLTIVLVLNLALIAGLLVVGIAAHSLGVVAAAGDYLADAAAIGVSLFAIALSHRPPTTRRPLGYPRATTIAAFVNGAFLLIVVSLVLVEALRRLISGTGQVHGLPVAIVSGIAAVVMIIGALILMGDGDDPGDDDGDAANMRAVLLDTIADAAAAAGAAITGLIIFSTDGLYWLDPAVALVIAAVVGYHVIVLLRGVLKTLRAPIL